jgi:hypothetical protein
MLKFTECTYSGLPLLKKGGCRIPAGKATRKNMDIRSTPKYYKIYKYIKHDLSSVKYLYLPYTDSERNTIQLYMQNRTKFRRI